MGDEGRFRLVRRTFFLSLAITALVRLYFVAGFLPELADRGNDLLQLDINMWVRRVGSVTWVLALAAGAAIVMSLVIRAYDKLGEDRAPSRVDR